ncbi:Zinc finger, RING/FYVE/PHD-type [Cynara cardunculus var. scolymus]|uniref:RING-type E3 ubiquitin transferase n=1 Tax=Cynara cardunculus var. scolymus TaxID=59895 RepID=A0A103XDK0_CYNCS|nr:Zinc finger, RING/FYVE/PHD-type [Cynara cardunculus var. scolymus]
MYSSMATTSISSCSYGIIVPDMRYFFLVNAEPGQYVDRLIIYTSSTDLRQRASMIQDYNDLISLFNDGPAYTTLRMEFTMDVADHGSVATARVLDGDEEPYEAISMAVARYIIHHESCCASGLIERKTLKRPFEIVRNGKQEDEDEEEEEEEGGDICVICQKEYEAHEMMRRLECKHGYHAECISKWLLRKNVCPICRADTVPWL